MVSALHKISVSISPLSAPLVRLGQGIDALICDGTALDEADPLQFWKRGKAGNRLVCQVRAATEIDVPNTVAAVD